MLVSLLVGMSSVFSSTAGAAVPPQAADGASPWTLVHEASGLSLRGLAVVDRDHVWATGNRGTVLRTTDGGAHWQAVGPRDCAGCDFRSVAAAGPDAAVVMVAGQPARVYRTTDGGASWTIVHADARAEAFFDAVAFDGARGFLVGDPIGGRFCVRTSTDGGASWLELPAGAPAAIDGEAAFAASGTCAVAVEDGLALATGGAVARWHRVGAAGCTVVDLPLAHGTESQGGFGIALAGSNGVVVGGDYRRPETAAGTAAFTTDGGASWAAASAGGFRSAAVWLDASTVLAVGERGASRSQDGGRTWQVFGDQGFHAIARGGDGAVYAAGGGGRIARLDVAEPFRPRRLFGDHMVLPAEARVQVQGFGTPGAAVEVSASWGARGTGVVGGDGRWSLLLATGPRGGEHTVTMRSAADEVVLHDVLLGDVWLASGQSNMEMPIGEFGGWKNGVADWQAEVAKADHHDLRVFTVAQRASGAPLDDVEGHWEVCTPATAKGFSATAYFFARDLLAAGTTPIGIVVSAWGGTVCEAWVSGEALAPFPEFAAALAATRAPRRDVGAMLAEFWQAVPAAPADGGWQDVTLPATWSADGLGAFDGIAFYRRVVELPPALQGHDLVLELGAIDDMDTTWVNGVRVGGLEQDGQWTTPRVYAVPKAAVAGARAEIVVRAVDVGGEGGFVCQPETMQLRAADGGGAVPLGGPWQRQRGPALRELPPFPREASDNPNRPAVLYNGMIAPLVPFPFAGAIWYQGESNRGRHDQYGRLFPAMIRDWRQRCAVPLPFHFVQIAPFAYDGNGLSFDLRLAQEAALALPDTGMVVTLDIGDAHDIHPKNKQEVGRRLALLAQRVPGGRDVVAGGPRAVRASAEGAAVRVVFADPAGKLGSAGALRGFELAAADGGFVAASARIDGDAVVVQADGVGQPTMVRYGAGDVPDANLVGGTGLPAAPFRLAIRREGR